MKSLVALTMVTVTILFPAPARAQRAGGACPSRGTAAPASATTALTGVAGLLTPDSQSLLMQQAYLRQLAGQQMQQAYWRQQADLLYLQQQDQEQQEQQRLQKQAQAAERKAAREQGIAERNERRKAALERRTAQARASQSERQR